jgi:hypothetical protein
MVSDVEELGPQANGVPLGDPEVFHQPTIQVDLIGPAPIAASTVAELISEVLSRRERRDHKRCGVVPALVRLVADRTAHRGLNVLSKRKIIRIANAIWPRREATGICGIERKDRGRSFARAGHYDT